MITRKGNKLNTTLHDRHFLQNCQAITFRKLKIIQNINNLMFHATFLFSDWIFIKQIIVFSTPFCCWGNGFSNYSAWGFDWGTGAWVKMRRFNAFSRNENSINSKFLPHMGEYKSQRKFSKHPGERQSPKEFKEMWEDVSLRLILKDKSGKQHCLPFCWL